MIITVEAKKSIISRSIKKKSMYSTINLIKRIEQIMKMNIIENVNYFYCQVNMNFPMTIQELLLQ